MNFLTWLITIKNKTITTANQYQYWVSKYEYNFKKNYFKIESKNVRKAVYCAFKLYYEFKDKKFPKNITFPKTNDPEVIFTSNLDYVQIMENYVCDNYNESTRNKLIVWLTYKHGLRIHEVLNLKTKNIFLDYIQIIGKGGKHRHVPLDNTMIKYVNFDQEYVIETKQSNQMTYSNVSKILVKIKEEVNITKNITWHSMRHGYAMRLLNNGIDIYTISKLLGHSSLQATEKYLHFNIEEAIKKLKEAKVIN